MELNMQSERDLYFSHHPTEPVRLSLASMLGGRDFDEASENDDSEDSEGEDDRAPPRTVWAWGGSFAVYQSRKKPGGHDLLEALKCEADEDLDFLPSSSSTCTLCIRSPRRARSWTPNS